jgi:uncharacterized membrane protein YjjP (DUF1212 family)
VRQRILPPPADPTTREAIGTGSSRWPKETSAKGAAGIVDATTRRAARQRNPTRVHSGDPQLCSAPVSDARRFVLELGRAMHALGSPSYRVEDTMDACGRALGMRGSYFATPTAIFASLGGDDGRQETILLRVQPGEHDLGRLAALHEVRDAVMRGSVDAGQGLARLAEVMAAPPTGGPLLRLTAFCLASAASSVLLGGGARETVVAGIAGLLVGGFAWFAQGRARWSRAFEAAAGAGAAFSVHAVAARWPLDAGVAILASIITLLPGIAFTAALAELAMRHLASGSARLLGSVAVLLTIAVGVGLGTRTGMLLFGASPDAAREPLPAVAHGLALLVATFAFAALLRASPGQLWAVLAGVLAGQLGGRLGGLAFERELSAFVGALVVVAAGNLYARWRRQPSAVVTTPGLLLLVPASLGFRGFTTGFESAGGTGVQLAFQMLLVGGALVAGLLVAGVLVPPPLDVEPDPASAPVRGAAAARRVPPAR